MNPLTPALAALVLTVTPVLIPSALAEPTNGSTCHGEMNLKVVPGLGVTPNRGSVFIRSGTINCDGPVQGRTITGPGKITGAARYGTKNPDSCTAGGEGWGVLRLDLPTGSGTLTVENPITYTFSPFSKAGLFSGDFAGDYFSGSFKTSLTKGNCVTSPATAGTFTFTGAMHDFQTRQ